MQNPILNNPVFSIISSIRSGRSPAAIIEQMAMADPRVRQAKQMISGKSEKELYQLVSNMCHERGTTPEELARSIGFQIPSNR